jgi:hypothetical protein
MGTVRQQLIMNEDTWTDRDPTGAARRPSPADDMPECSHIVPITHTLETEVIPRLVLSPVPATLVTADPADVLSLVGIVLKDELTGALDFVRTLLARGTTLEEIYLDLLTPAARHLGSLWDEDLCDFTDVTLGLWRLHQVLADLGPSFEQGTSLHPAGVQNDQTHRALLLPLPGSQHTFGLLMVADFFRARRHPARSVPHGPAQLVWPDRLLDGLRD